MLRIEGSWRGVRRRVAPLAVTIACTGASAAPIVTRHAAFEAQRWQDVPGWSADTHADALRAFQRACGTLGGRRAWQAACDSARSVVADSPAAARGFFESQFTLYRVEDRGAIDGGLLTGYFEPVLSGRRQRGGSFVFPVYGPPPDMLHLDARTIPRGTSRLQLSRRGNELVVDPTGPYSLDPATLGGAPMDQRHRLRIDGQRAVGYWSRQEIEGSGAVRAPVIAWVDDINALYVMQVQGSGRIRMPDGRQIRVAYADQNGHPFTPRGAAGGVRTRGIGDQGATGPSDPPDVDGLSDAVRSLVGDDAADSDDPTTSADAAIRTRGIRPKDNEAAVDRMVEQLLAQQAPRRAGAPRDAGTGRSSSDASGGEAIAGIGVAPKEASRQALAALAYLVAARRLDRSYVFFREHPRIEDGPRGALGVPLTAGRSIAVDPRVTPLGAPVFIEATRPDGQQSIRRLMVAQDTGGAIRGAVRADFFWGSGPGAGARALQTRDRLSMWVLLPRGLAFGRPAGVRTRAIDDEEAPDCVIDDPEFCAR